MNEANSMQKKLLFIIILSVTVSGCGETLKSNWNNFRAYYNTFYNAKEHYSAGLKKVDEQPVVLDPTDPVRVHPSPVPAGDEELGLAIEKGAQVLQSYDKTQWVDDALLLTGKSFYYRQEYYPALQRFEELLEYSSEKKMAELAAIWKGRTLLDLGLYTEGVEFMEDQISRLADAGSNRKAEMQVLTAEHYALMDEWEQAANWLARAVKNIEDNRLAGRTFFLYGQVLERSERFGEAYHAYSRVSDYFAGFEYAYWAGFKQADVARMEGNMDLALSIYEGLLNDDKNHSRRDQIFFQIARTNEMKGEFDRAILQYNKLLGTTDRQLREIKAEAYHRLSKIYGDIYKEYSTAAAYIDSSTAISDETSRGPASDKQMLSGAYNRYVQLQEQESRADSLLWLGSLPPAELDSVLEQLRLQKREQLIEQQKADSEEKLVNHKAQDISQKRTSPLYGFLNHRNDELVGQMRTNFKVVWGDRPLQDNWRRMDAIQHTVTDNSTEDTVEEVPAAEITGAGLDTEEIPTTEAQRAQLRAERTSVQYELGNLLFFNLEEPDNARSYFYRVVNRGIDQPDLRGKAMYSLYESFKARSTIDSLRYWRNRLIEEYPDSPYAQRLHPNISGEDLIRRDSTHVLRRQFESIIASGNPYKGARLRSLAARHRNMDLAPVIYFEAVEEYIRQAKAKIQLVDTFPVFGDRLVELQKEEGDYFRHTYWDSVRVVLQEFDELFPGAARSEKVTELRAALGQQ